VWEAFEALPSQTRPQRGAKPAKRLTALAHELATKVDAALQQVMAGRDLAAKLSLDANSKAGEASKLLGDVLAALPR
jgi:type VI protein secretion system component VasA